MSDGASRFMTEKQRLAQEREAWQRNEHTYACPDCGGQCHFMGIDFRVPKVSDIKAWQKAEAFILSGNIYYLGNLLVSVESPDPADPQRVRAPGRRAKSRIMYIELKAGGLTGPARIGRVTFSKTGATLYYGGKSFRSLKGFGYKSNYFDVESGEEYWISGPRKDGRDGLYPSHATATVDADVHDEYWTKIRGLPVPPPAKATK
ncbi:MAG: hypothetical protein LBP52_05385 [Burkholderiaceae bacterium]|jgi:hypothetical protein|nr:hypothetical protein [Burkholderiaceae bacterium]